jgi:hypothetical protein
MRASLAEVAPAVSTMLLGSKVTRYPRCSDMNLANACGNHAFKCAREVRLVRHAVAACLGMSKLAGTHILEGRHAVVVLEERELAEYRGASPAEAERVRVGLQPRLQQVEGQLVLGEAHLDDAAGVGDGVVWVFLILLPPQEVGRVLAVAVAGGLLGQQLRLRLLVGDHAHHTATSLT